MGQCQWNSVADAKRLCAAWRECTSFFCQRDETKSIDRCWARGGAEPAAFRQGFVLYRKVGKAHFEARLGHDVLAAADVRSLGAAEWRAIVPSLPTDIAAPERINDGADAAFDAMRRSEADAERRLRQLRAVRHRWVVGIVAAHGGVQRDMQSMIDDVLGLPGVVVVSMPHPQICVDRDSEALSSYLQTSNMTREAIENVTVFVCAFPASACQFFLPFNKPTIVYTTLRLDRDYCNAPRLHAHSRASTLDGTPLLDRRNIYQYPSVSINGNKGMRRWIDELRTASSQRDGSSRVWLVPNNRYDERYLQQFFGIRCL